MKIIAHKVGNKINGESYHLYPEELQLDDQKTELLKNYFLGSFKDEETFQFYSNSYLENNPIYSSVSKIFEAPLFEFVNESENIAKHLYESAENPRVQGGELFIVYFINENEDEVAKIGIFKTEKREPFLKIFSQDEGMDIEQDQGISLNKIDKATLIYNTGKETGYVLSVVDNNKNGDMYYWFEDFLKVRQREDDFFNTAETLVLCKNFITDQLPQEFEISKVDQIDFLSKSIDFFKDRELFNLDEFVNEVLEDKAVIESFDNYKTDYEQDMQVNISEDFIISNPAVKKTQKLFKTVIKLDKNFDINIHGDRKLIESGTDEKGKFYKLYFENEK